jgi:diacylglycerol kinase
LFGLFKSVIDLATDVAEVVATPVEMAVDLVGAAVKPLAEVAADLKNDIKSLKD